MQPLQFTTAQRYPASLERLWRACARPGYVGSKYRALGSSSVRLREFRGEPGRIEVLLERTLSLLPLERLIGSSSLVLRHHSQWRRTEADGAQVQVQVTPVGLPLHAEAAGALREVSPDCTEMTLQWQVSCDASWVPRSAQRLFAHWIREGLRRDHAFTVAYLRDHAGAAPSARLE